MAARSAPSVSAMDGTVAAVGVTVAVIVMSAANVARVVNGRRHPERPLVHLGAHRTAPSVVQNAVETVGRSVVGRQAFVGTDGADATASGATARGPRGVRHKVATVGASATRPCPLHRQ